MSAWKYDADGNADAKEDINTSANMIQIKNSMSKPLVMGGKYFSFFSSGASDEIKSEFPIMKCSHSRALSLIFCCLFLKKKNKQKKKTR